MGDFAVNAYKGKGISRAQNTARRVIIKPDLMNKYLIRSSSQTSNNSIQGVIYTNKAMNTSTGLQTGDKLVVTIVDGT